MTELLIDGEVVASWMLDPVTGKMCVAERGSGAYLDGERITTVQDSPGLPNICGVIATRFMPPDMQASMKTKAQAFGEIKPLSFCAGADYPAVATDDWHFILYWRVLPWDYVPGALFLSEAGGYVARPSGEAYRVGLHIPGLLIARNHDIWHSAQASLFPA